MLGRWHQCLVVLSLIAVSILVSDGSIPEYIVCKLENQEGGGIGVKVLEPQLPVGSDYGVWQLANGQQIKAVPHGEMQQKELDDANAFKKKIGETISNEVSKSSKQQQQQQHSDGEQKRVIFLGPPQKMRHFEIGSGERWIKVQKVSGKHGNDILDAKNFAVPRPKAIGSDTCMGNLRKKGQLVGVTSALAELVQSIHKTWVDNELLVSRELHKHETKPPEWAKRLCDAEKNSHCSIMDSYPLYMLAGTRIYKRSMYRTIQEGYSKEHIPQTKATLYVHGDSRNKWWGLVNCGQLKSELQQTYSELLSNYRSMLCDGDVVEVKIHRSFFDLRLTIQRSNMWTGRLFNTEKHDVAGFVKKVMSGKGQERG